MKNNSKKFKPREPIIQKYQNCFICLFGFVIIIIIFLLEYFQFIGLIIFFSTCFLIFFSALLKDRLDKKKTSKKANQLAILDSNNLLKTRSVEIEKNNDQKENLFYNYCEYCGQEILDNVLSCPHCNNKLTKLSIDKKIISFRGAEIPKYEVEVLTDLELILEEDFRLVSNYEIKDSMCFSTELNHVKSLCINNWKLTILPEKIGELKSLEYLDLFCSIKFLPEPIWNLKQLKVLNLGGNKINYLSESIENLMLLEELYLHSSHIKYLPNSMKNLKSLKKLNLAHNKLESLPEWIQNLILLEELDVSDNELHTIPESVGNLTFLQELKLSENKLVTLPDSISNLKALKTLEYNGNDIDFIPNYVLNLDNLKYLVISEKANKGKENKLKKKILKNKGIEIRRFF